MIDEYPRYTVGLQPFHPHLIAAGPPERGTLVCEQRTDQIQHSWLKIIVQPATADNTDSFIFVRILIDELHAAESAVRSGEELFARARAYGRHASDRDFSNDPAATPRDGEEYERCPDHLMKNG